MDQTCTFLSLPPKNIRLGQIGAPYCRTNDETVNFSLRSSSLILLPN